MARRRLTIKLRLSKGQGQTITFLRGAGGWAITRKKILHRKKTAGKQIVSGKPRVKNRSSAFYYPGPVV